MLIAYSNIPKEKYYPQNWFALRQRIHVYLDGEEVTTNCYGFLSILGFGYVKCFKPTKYVLDRRGLKHFTLDHEVLYIEGDAVARHPTRYGRVKICVDPA